MLHLWLGCGLQVTAPFKAMYDAAADLWMEVYRALESSSVDGKKVMGHRRQGRGGDGRAGRGRPPCR